MSMTLGSAGEWLSSMRSTWGRLKERAEDIQALEPRTRDVLWPLFHYRNLDMELFDRSSMLLLANEDEKKLILNELAISDTYAQVSKPEPAVTWFWLHQMVHVAQGLSYRAFRDLNTEPDRIETTRADVWADFIALKTLAIFDLLETGDSDQVNTRAIRDREHTLFQDVVWPMVNMRQPNHFIPFEREFEARRVLSLLVLGTLLEEITMSNGAEMIDESIFVNWRPGKAVLYIWYGQTNLLGRRPIIMGDNEIHLIITAIQNAQFDEAYARVHALPLPKSTELEEYCRRSVS